MEGEGLFSFQHLHSTALATIICERISRESEREREREVERPIATEEGQVQVPRRV